MKPKILTIFLIIVALVSYTKQDDAKATTKAATKAPAKTTTPVATAAPVVAAAPYWGGWPVDWNHDGIIDWRDGWNGWNNGWRGDWNPAWGYNGAWDRNGDGVIDWRDGAWGGWRGNWGAPVVTEPVVSRRLGERNVASTLRKSEVRPVDIRSYGDYTMSFVMKKDDTPDDYGYPDDGMSSDNGMGSDDGMGSGDYGYPDDGMGQDAGTGSEDTQL